MDRQGNARAHRVHQNAPELAQAMTDGIVSLNDATRIQFEPEDVRRQAVDDVREGRPRPARVPSVSVTAATQYPIPTRRRTAPPISRRPCMPRRPARSPSRPACSVSFASCSAK